ncbi:MAG TPA: phage baseplate assembly protein V, partial [Chitinophagaceae bacterium]
WPASGIIPAVSGLQVGVVTQIENDPLSEDRVLVKIPMADAEADGVWARQALLDAGKERGSFFRPEVGDEVILGFINDDPRHPVILGMLNSSALPAIMPAKNVNHEKGFVTREKLTLWFNDEKKIIKIATPGKNSLTLDDDAGKIILKDQHNNEITMSEEGIMIKSAKDIKLEAASGKLALSSNELEAKANSSAKISGSSAEMSASGTTTVKGSMVQIN